jgi:hypothetical protein
MDSSGESSSMNTSGASSSGNTSGASSSTLITVVRTRPWITPGHFYKGAAKDFSPPLEKEVCVLPIIQKNGD